MLIFDFLAQNGKGMVRKIFGTVKERNGNDEGTGTEQEKER